MATTGTYSYNPTVSSMVTDALRILSVLEEGTTASTAQLTDSLPAFEMYVKGLGKYGLNLWATETQSITLTASCTYSPPRKFLRITDASYRDSNGEDTDLIMLTRQEYWNLSNKDQTGQPTQLYYNPQETAALSTVHLWPCPDTNNYGNGETVELTGQILFQDVGDGTATLDVPQDWLETVKYGLATRLAPMYGYPVQERRMLGNEYKEMLMESLDSDTEFQSIYFTAEDRG